MAQITQRKISGRQQRLDSATDDWDQDAPKAAKIKVRYAESKQVRDMRENFEKAEKRAMRSSKAYRYTN